MSHLSVAKNDRVLLEGPHSRTTEFWLVLRALRDFIEGFRTLHFVGPCVTVFGSARYDESHPYYALGRDVGRGVAELGFTAMTGGGPGLMEAVNRGAREAGGRSASCSVVWRQGSDRWGRTLSRGNARGLRGLGVVGCADVSDRHAIHAGAADTLQSG